jgi:hypothetical protein
MRTLDAQPVPGTLHGPQLRPPTLFRESLAVEDLMQLNNSNPLGIRSDDAVLEMWRMVCRRELDVTPIEEFATYLHSLSVYRQAYTYYICSSERTIEPTMGVMRALFSGESTRCFVVAPLEMKVRRDVMILALDNIEYFADTEGSIYSFILPALLVCRYALYDADLLRRIVAASGDPPADFIENLACCTGSIRSFDRISFDEFECLPVFLRVLAATSTIANPGLSLVPVDLFSLAVLHAAIDCGWTIDASVEDHLHDSGDEDDVELCIAQESLSIIQGWPLNWGDLAYLPLPLTYSNWHRNRFMQECLARVGNRVTSLFAVDSKVVAEWIVTHGDAKVALKKYIEVRGTDFNIYEVQPIILANITT